MRFQPELLTQFEAEIRKGRRHHVAKALSKINSASVPRNHRLALANIARRVSVHALGLKLLGPLVYPERGRADATPQEIAEYAVLLVRSGIHREARRLLAGIDPGEAPESLLFRAFTHFERWEFEPAVGLLEDYVNADVSPYLKLVGRVNLAYAYVGSRRRELAEPLLAENIRLCERGGYGVLQANCFELLTRLYTEAGDLARASTALSHARRIAGLGQAVEHRLIAKWTAILQAMKTRDMAPLLAYKASLPADQSEYLRESDRFALQVHFETGRFEHLIYGTSFYDYREIVYHDLGRQVESTTYRLGPDDAPALDLLTGEVDGRAQLDRGSKCHALVEILLRDFYKGLPLGEIFAELYPGERFDIFSSPNRVRQILHRTREALAGLPVEIQHRSGIYRLIPNRPFSFLITLNRQPVEGYHQYLNQLRLHYGPSEVFRVNEARIRLNVPRTTFFRFTTWAVQNGALERIGDFNTSKYKLVS